MLITSGSHLLTNLAIITPSWILSYKSSDSGSIGILEPQSGSSAKILFIIWAYLFFSVSKKGLFFLLISSGSCTRKSPIPSFLTILWNFSLVPASIIFFKKIMQLNIDTAPSFIKSVSSRILSKSSSDNFLNLNSKSFSLRTSFSILPDLKSQKALNKSSYSWKS